MKKLIVLIALLVVSLASFAQKKGYKVEFNFKQPISGDVVYLTRYFAKPFPSLFKMDSVIVKDRNKIVFESKEEILGGFYAIIYNNRNKVLDFVLDNGTKMVINTDTTAKRAITTVKGSLDNEINFNLGKIGEKYDAEFEAAKNDTAKLRKLQEKVGNEINDYRAKVIKEHPNLLVTKYYKTFQNVEIPKGPHYLADGKTVDSFYNVNYLSNHYFDNFDLKDDRLIIAPIYERALETYFNNFVYPIPDSFIERSNVLLAKMDQHSEMYKFTMRWLTTHILKSNVMGLDEAYVYLVDNYHTQGKTPWLDEAGVKEYVDIAKKISPTIMGQTAPALEMQDLFTQQPKRLADVEGTYTVVLFWDVECGNCRSELMALDTMYRTELKEKGVKIYAVATNGQLDKIQNFLKENNATEWTNVADFDNTKAYKETYNVLGTPAMFLLDKDKKIIGKKISHLNLKGIIEWHIKKQSQTTTDLK